MSADLRVLEAEHRALLRAVIYVRISEDEHELAIGIRDQIKHCIDLCQRRGYALIVEHVPAHAGLPAGVLGDNDISAHGGEHRPEYARLIDLMRDGRVDVVVTWHEDRIDRRVTNAVEHFERAGRRGRVTLVAVKGGYYDLSTARGRADWRGATNESQYDSEHKSENVLKRLQEKAEAGETSGGAVPFGFRDEVELVRRGEGATGRRRIATRPVTRRVLDEGEAPLIRNAVERVLAGASLHELVRDWNSRTPPVLTRFGNPWSITSLRVMLMSGRLAGLRDHRVTEPVDPERPNGRRRLLRFEQHAGQWPQIIEPDQHTALVALLTRRRRAEGDPLRRRRLLTGLVFCGLCGQPLIGATTSGGQPARQGYVCARNRHLPLNADGAAQYDRGCFKVSIIGEPLDDLIVRAVVARWDSAEFVAAVAAARDGGTDRPSVIRRRLVELDEAVSVLAETFGGVQDREALRRGKAKIDAERNALHGELAQHAEHAQAERLAREYAGCVGERWHLLDDGVRRELIEAQIERIVILPAPPRPTVADVAERAQTSKVTVARVLRGTYPHIRPEVRERVQRAIDDLGYRSERLDPRRVVPTFRS